MLLNLAMCKKQEHFFPKTTVLDHYQRHEVGTQEALEAHTWNKNAAANWLLQGGSNLPPLPALRRSTTDRSSANTPTGQPGMPPDFPALKLHDAPHVRPLLCPN